MYTDYAMDIDRAIRELEHVPRHIFSNDVEKAMNYAIDFLKMHSEKPSLDDTVDCIKYYRGYKDDWKWYTHVPTDRYLCSMKIGDLVDLVKTGRLDNDCFAKTYKSRGHRLDSYYVKTIKYMLMMNGYITKEEYEKEWRK